MKRPLFPAIVVIALGSCLSLCSCTLATWARIFNRANHEISVLQTDRGKTITIGPGANAPIALWAVSRDDQQGFLIRDHGQEFFYAMVPERKNSPTGALFLPRESAKRRSDGLEYFFEYSADSEIFALSPMDEKNPKRVDPQPAGFPIKPR
jgi:hypothetical protein